MIDTILWLLLAGVLIASLGLAALLEYNRYRLYQEMIAERCQYYRDGSEYFRSKI